MGVKWVRDPEQPRQGHWQVEGDTPMERLLSVATWVNEWLPFGAGAGATPVLMTRLELLRAVLDEVANMPPEATSGPRSDEIRYIRGATLIDHWRPHEVGFELLHGMDRDGWYPITYAQPALRSTPAHHDAPVITVLCQVMRGSRPIRGYLPLSVYNVLPRGDAPISDQS